MSKNYPHNSLEYLLNIGDWQQVIALCSVNLASHPEELKLLVYLGVAYSRIGDRSAATDCFKKASELLPEDISFQISIAKLLLEIGKNQEANKIVETAITINGDSPELLVQKGWIELKSYNYKKSLINFNRALEINPDFEPAKKGKETVIASKTHADSAVSRIENLGKYVADRCGERVIDGPFAGMKYPSNFSSGPSKSALAQKLLGCYEKELHAAIFMLMREQYDVFLNIGCAEGYYTVGLARKFPNTKVIAYDLDATAREECRYLAEINDQGDKVTVKDYCGISELNQQIAGRTLIICDVDGSEADLLHPDLVPALVKADLIVELHDIYVKGLSEFMVKRFQPTHEVALLSVVPRNDGLFTAIAELSFEDRQQAIYASHPPDMKWGLFLSKEYLRDGKTASFDNKVTSVAVPNHPSFDFKENLKLRDINLVIFPDWRQSEESWGWELQEIIKAIASHPDKGRITLLIDKSNISDEDADLALSSVAMNLLMEEDLDVSEGPEISLVGNLSQVQWQTLLSLVRGRIALECENKEAIARVKADSIGAIELDNLSDQTVGG